MKTLPQSSPVLLRAAAAAFEKRPRKVRFPNGAPRVMLALGVMLTAAAAWAWTPPGSGWNISERGPDYRKWNKVGATTNEAGMVVMRTNTIVELGGGMNVKRQGDWAEAAPEVVPTVDGALCRGARHEVWLASNLKTWGSVRVHTEQDNWVKANVLALGYYSADSGQSVTLAQVKDCQGAIVGTNQVLYEDAFDGLKASVRYSYTKSGFEQDILLRQCPPSPASLGLTSDKVSLYVLSELVDTPPPDRVAFEVPAPSLGTVTNMTGSLSNSAPATGSNLLATATNQRSAAAQPKLANVKREDVLSFGGMFLARGKAFEMGTAASQKTMTITNRVTGAVRQLRHPVRNTPVRARWFQSEGRSFLLEEVPLKDVRQQLQKLPLTASARPQLKANGNLYKVLSHLVPPPVELARQPKGRMLLAKATEGRPAFVIDYYFISPGGNSNFTFDNSTTYVVSEDCYFYGTTTISDGAVIKYSPNDCDMVLYGPVVCPWEDMAYITSTEDDSVGDLTSQGIGLYPGRYTYGLHIDGASSGPVQLQNLQIAYAAQGVHLYDSDWPSTAHTVNSCTFSNCISAFCLEQTKVESSGCHFYSSDYNTTPPFDGSHYLFTGSGLYFELWGWDYFAQDYLAYDTGTYPQSAVRLSGCDLYPGDGTSNPMSTNGPVVVLIDPPTVTMTVADGSATKGTSDTGTFTFSRSGDTSQDLYVAFAISGTAVSGVDYSALPVGVTIPQGYSTASLTVTPADQNPLGKFESTVRVQLTENPMAYFLSSPNLGTVTIVDPSAPPPPPAPDPSGLVAWWRAESNAVDSVGGNNGTLQSGVSYAPGRVGTAFNFAAGNNGVLIPASSSLNVGASSGLTIEGWICPSDISNWGPLAEWNTGSSIGAHFYLDDASYDGPGGLYANLLSTDGATHAIHSPGRLLQTGVFQHVAVTYDKTTGLISLYCSGALVAQQYFGSFIPQTACNLYLGKRPGAHTYTGLMDEMSIYNRALATNEIQALYDAGPTGKSRTLPPFIGTQPASQSACIGETVSFTVAAGGESPLSLQWQFNGFDLPGQTSATLTLTNVQCADAGSYSVVVNNAFGSVVSSNALLTVGSTSYSPAASFSTNSNPNGNWSYGLSATLGGSMTLYTDAGIDSYSLSYWRSNLFWGVPAVTYNATGSVQGPSSIRYNPHQLSFHPGINRIFCVIRFTAPQSGQYGVTANFSGMDQHGTTTDVHILTNGTSIYDGTVWGFGASAAYAGTVTLNQGTSLDFVVGDGNNGEWYDTTGLDAKVIALPQAPIITQQPLSVATNAGANVTFSVSASGTAPLGYQWRFNGADLPGATSSTCSLSSVSTNQSGEYSVVVTNTLGSAESAAALLTVVPADWFTQYWGANYQSNTNAALGADPNGNGLSNWQEFLMGRNPLATNTVGDTNGAIGLRVFTPLK